jgi:hypothetical protein
MRERQAGVDVEAAAGACDEDALALGKMAEQRGLRDGRCPRDPQPSAPASFALRQRAQLITLARFLARANRAASANTSVERNVSRARVLELWTKLAAGSIAESERD